MTRALTLLSFFLLAQNEIRVDVQLQQIVVTVKDGEGNLVKNLRANDFILEEDGVPQTITHFVQDNDTPVSLGILVDVSGSMASTPAGPNTALRAALGTALLLVHLMKPQDEFSLMSFASGVDLRQSFTQDRAKIEDALFKLQTGGGTNLQEGVEEGLKQTRKGKHRKKALVVITDAQASLNSARLQRAVIESEVVIYTFALQATDRPAVLPMTPPRPDVLDLLASESGGRSMAFGMHSEDVINRMMGFVQDIAAELRGQYLIGYYPQKSGVRGSQAIRVRTKSPNYRARYQREALQLPQNP
jgi:Ca-activated chloride channel family protein